MRSGSGKRTCASMLSARAQRLGFCDTPSW